MTRTRDTSVRREKVVQAATQLFAGQGYHGTHTREIAQLADLSETTLFRYFQNKEEIFLAALRDALRQLCVPLDLLEKLTKFDRLDSVLPELISLLTDAVVLRPHLLQLIAVGLIEMRWKSESLCLEYFGPLFSFLRQYFANAKLKGLIRNLDPSILSVSLLASVIIDLGFSRIVSGAAPPFSDRRDASGAFVQFWSAVLESKRDA